MPAKKSLLVPPTEVQTASIVLWMGKGAIPETAAARAGVSKTQLLGWMRAGAAGEKPFDAFCARLDAALIDLELSLLEQIYGNVNKNLHAAQWVFNTRFGTKYKRAADLEAGISPELAGLSLGEVSQKDIEAAERRAMAAASELRPEPTAKKPNFGLEEGPFGGHKARH